MGLLNRETRQVRAKVIPHARREVLQGEILKHVGFNAHVYTDGHVGYDVSTSTRTSLIAP